MKINEVIDLSQKYGNNTNLGELVKIIQGNKHHICPKCKGLGYTVEIYNAYPTGLPDSGWVYEEGKRKVKCDLCHGEGYTEHEYKPKMIQDGWE